MRFWPPILAVALGQSGKSAKSGKLVFGRGQMPTLILYTIYVEVGSESGQSGHPRINPSNRRIRIDQMNPSNRPDG
ncbi:hypothetical protein RIR_jg10839.t1 [Rhizophagus irregularis DAOM 181602=DAOM 197198]|uniref:Uncharacterized protein n=1 Tax=Rhizophagus irregularis (strain DAOM 197198w) TaxID=1432141 RepID=A0A015JYJ9_RHIIW|nr:hypothetical protein RirG_069210 [Rhizophagus irregularis DAOM 197198w]GBC28792.1 hypothetical protein RIR_jg10839.t1 [Rhizophagus irregularis DAOM 181602=DAOM 197198]